MCASDSGPQDCKVLCFFSQSLKIILDSVICEENVTTEDYGIILLLSLQLS